MPVVPEQWTGSGPQQQWLPASVSLQWIVLGSPSLIMSPVSTAQLAEGVSCHCMQLQINLLVSLQWHDPGTADTESTALNAGSNSCGLYLNSSQCNYTLLFLIPFSDNQSQHHNSKNLVRTSVQNVHIVLCFCNMLRAPANMKQVTLMSRISACSTFLQL